METNKKFIISLTSVAVVAVAAIVSLVVVLAAFTVTTTNDFKISYSAAGVEATVSGQYKNTIGGEYQSMTPASITFDREATGDAQVNKAFDAMNDLSLNKDETFVMKYTIANNSATVGIDINFTMVETPDNMTCKYAFNTTGTEPTWANAGDAASIADAAIDAGADEEGYIWVLFQITDKNQDASFTGKVTCQLTAVNPAP